MTTDDDGDRDDEVQDASVWAQMRAAHKTVSGARAPLVLELPGYGHLGIAVRYQYVAITDIRSETAIKRLQKLKQQTRQAVDGAAASIAMACDCIMVLAPNDPQADKDGYVPLCDGDGVPVKFDLRLCRNMGLPTTNADGKPLAAAAIVRVLFGGQQGEHRLLEHARELAEWMGGEREQVAEEYLGN